MEVELDVGKWRVVREPILLPDGRVLSIHYVDRLPSVVIIPVVGGEVVLEKQFRKVLKKWIYELPAGTVEEEDPLNAAKRELEEEVGYRAKEWKSLGAFYATPGYSTEVIHVFVARGLEYVGEKRGDMEFIETVRMSLDEALSKIGMDIVDMKTALGLLLYERFVRGE